MRIIVLFAFTVSLAAQLPPEIMVDRYLLQVERAIEKEDIVAAQAAIDQIRSLEATKGLALPAKFYFRAAQVARTAGQNQRAVEFVTKYLTIAGQEGEFYIEALELLEEAEADHFNAEQICTGKPKGSECWMELTSHPGCYFWNYDLDDRETASWSGECADGLAQGIGTLAWKSESGELKYEETGSLRGGKAFGEWVLRYPKGSVGEGPYENGERHGQWSFQWADNNGNLTGGGMQGPYVGGKMHGRWVARWSDGTIEERPYVDGKRHGQLTGRNGKGKTWEIAYVSGKRHGLSRWLNADGSVESKGAFVNDEKHGRWSEDNIYDGLTEKHYVNGVLHGPYIERNDEGNVTERGQYEDGNKHGEWIIDYRGDGFVDEKGAYVEGVKHGRWTEVEYRDSHDEHVNESRVVIEGEYASGERIGRWKERFNDGCSGTGEYAKREYTWLRHGQWTGYVSRDGKVESYEIEGEYVYGERHGQWKIIWDRRVDEGRFENGKRQGHWIFRFKSGGLWAGSFVNDKMHGEWVYRKKVGGGIKNRAQWQNGYEVK